MPAVSTPEISADFAERAMELAEHHLPKAEMLSSAELALSDARGAFDHPAIEESIRASLRSLRYSVGIFHPDYQTVGDVLRASLCTACEEARFVQDPGEACPRCGDVVPEPVDPSVAYWQ